MFKITIIVLVLSALFISCSNCEDFYELLRIRRDADDRTIRQAFKKLAITLHPDKNQADSTAHEKFVRLTRAYEVLKDKELRSKYDALGEAGLTETGSSQPQYQSWQFYKYQFGIYDDDLEISTLNAHDFESLVLNGGRLWFVNFYSAQCSHCHELAPEWRQFARQVEGVIGVGAVNCLDEHFLCQQQRIGHYPLLILYPSGERYNGPRNVEDFVDFVVERLEAEVIHLTKDTFEANVANRRDKPWIIALCDDESTYLSINCLSWRARKLVAASLNNAVHVGFVDCNVQEALCENLGGVSGIYYFDAGKIVVSAGKRIQSLEAKEIVSMALQLMPDFIDLEQQKMDEMTGAGRFGSETGPWLVRFTNHGSQSDENFEYRLLPSMLELSTLPVKVGMFNCTKHASTCQRLQLTTFPAYVIFKPQLGFEIHYGKSTLHDVVSFARECAYTNVKTLSAIEFSGILSKDDSDQPWLIDFFAPWCPPCMRLLPEFRKASKILGDSIQFGTVDCTVNNQACLAANVNSYPTTILYNGSKTNAFVGLHNTQELVDFVENIINPPVISLTAETFSEKVLDKKDEDIWLVDFYSPDCAPCLQLAPEIRKLAKLFREYSFVHVADVDCSKFGDYCSQMHNIRTVPTIRVYPRNRERPMDYNSWFRDVMSLRTWLFSFFPSRVSELTTEDFHGVLNSEGPWLIVFYAPWCHHCHVFATEFEKVADALDGRLRFGKINCEVYVFACQSAIIQAYPAVRFYAGVGGQLVDSQNAYGFAISSQNSDDLIRIVEALLSKHSVDKSTMKRDEL